MKKPIVIAFVLQIAISLQLLPQSSFEITISNEKDQVINSVIENDEGDFVMVGRIHDDKTGIAGGYILKVDCNGRLLSESIFQSEDTTSCLFFNIHYFNDFYYILGSKSISNTDQSALWYLKLNAKLEVENENLLGIPNGRWFSYMNSIIDSDSNFVLTGYTTAYQTYPSYVHNPFYYKLSATGDSLNSEFIYTSSIWTVPFDLIESRDSTSYHVFYSRYDDTSPGHMLTINKNFELLNAVPIPLDVHNYYSPVFINDTSILVCGAGTPSQSNFNYLNVVSMTEAGQMISYNHFFKDSQRREQPSMHKGISKSGNNIYIGGTSNFDNYNPFFSSLNSWFHLVKINPDITPIWEYWYGGDAYYFLYSILATNDGGCIMVGNRYDFETQIQERDIYIVKVDTNGLITWTQEIPINKSATTVYPNPGKNKLNIKTSNKYSDFELINLNGQVVITKMLDDDFSIINTESLKSGVYFYRLFDKNNKTLDTGKWIKQ